mgnify:CR=1 FL=1|tara:strand:+ start:231 stop:452 length:222 start_codon:yes stop_codon:yes gene_type:complete
MIPEIAKKLLPLINTKKNTDALQLYAVDRIEFIHRQLEIATSWDEVKELQGQAKETRRLLSLKDEVEQRAREK